MSNAKFKRDYARILAKVGDKSNLLVRTQAAGLGASLIERSPVDEGTFKGNWQYGNVTINVDTSSPADKTGTSAQGRINAGLALWKPGQTIWLTNSMPYARRLEYGWSKQSPGGMVRLAVAEFKSNIARIAAGIR